MKKIAVSQDGKILRLRSYSDIQNLDPAYRKAAPEDDIMRNIFVGLAGMKAGDEWAWELDGASKLEQVDDTHVQSRVVLRVPQADYDRVLTELAGTGTLLARTSTANEVLRGLVEIHLLGGGGAGVLDRRGPGMHRVPGELLRLRGVRRRDRVADVLAAQEPPQPHQGAVPAGSHMQGAGAALGQLDGDGVLPAPARCRRHPEGSGAARRCCSGRRRSSGEGGAARR